MEAQRFSIIMYTGSNVSRETSTNASSSMSVGGKVGMRIVISSSQGYSYANCCLLILQRKPDPLELDRESAAEEEEVLLRANFEEFMRRLRHKVGTLFSLSHVILHLVIPLLRVLLYLQMNEIVPFPFYL